jgi:hypothetical protein
LWRCAGLLAAAEKSQGQLAGLLDPVARWPTKLADPLAALALRCVKLEPKERPKLMEVLSELQALRD